MTEHLASLFPALSDYSVTSPQDARYNCIAWAVGADARWWWPDRYSYWPPGVPRENSVNAFVAAFAALGYERCDNGSLESGFEKVAIFGSSSGVTHMARQLSAGRWTSKIGQIEDIEHATPADLEGCAYGAVVMYMRRGVNSPSAPT